MIVALVYPILLGLDRLETASFLRFNGTFQYLTGLPSFPDPQTLRRFLHQAPDSLIIRLRPDRLLSCLEPGDSEPESFVKSFLLSNRCRVSPTTWIGLLYRACTTFATTR